MTQAANQPVRLAELMAALSLATDLGTGQPMEFSLRTCLLSMQAARQLGISNRDSADAYYLALLRFVGCTSDAHEAALAAGGDEISFHAGMGPVIMGDKPEFLAHMVRQFAAGSPPLTRLRLLASALAEGSSGPKRAIAAHCEVAQMLASRMGLRETVGQFVGSTFERWDGKGIPGLLSGDAIPSAVRIVTLAGDSVVFYHLGGWDLVCDVLRRRRGKAYDPDMADVFLAHGERWLVEAAGDSVWDAALTAEPAPQEVVDDARLDAVLGVLADFVDLKSPFTLGHSSAVAELAAAAAHSAGLSAEEVQDVRRAALVHDLGKVGIPNGILEKPGPLSPAEWERVRLHPYLTERVLSRSPALGRIAPLASAHHERADGSGYHRGVGSGALSVRARLLAVANAYQAMGQDRPYRPPLDEQERVAALQKEANAGRLDSAAVRCVLAAAGETVPIMRTFWPNGLTDREVEVLRLVSRGASKRVVGSELFISPKTVGRHIENIYAKIGVSSRASAALFALQNGLLHN